MTTRTLTAMFNSKPDAERAGQMLVSELKVDRAMIQTSPGEGVTDTGYDKSRPYEEKGFFGSLKSTAVPDEDRYTYAEGMRRGSVLLTVQVDEAHLDLAAFQERTIEARATSEEAVVSKEARVVEEIGVTKQAADRVETVRDTVRETKVDIEDTTATASTGTASVAGGAGIGGTKPIRK